MSHFHESPEVTGSGQLLVVVPYILLIVAVPLFKNIFCIFSTRIKIDFFYQEFGVWIFWGQRDIWIAHTEQLAVVWLYFSDILDLEFIVRVSAAQGHEEITWVIVTWSLIFRYASKFQAADCSWIVEWHAPSVQHLLQQKCHRNHCHHSIYFLIIYAWFFQIVSKNKSSINYVTIT